MWGSLDQSSHERQICAWPPKLSPQSKEFPMAYISKRNRRKEKEKQTASNNRAELIAAGFKRRDLLKMGLLTSAGMLIPKKGLSAHPRSEEHTSELQSPCNLVCR